MSRKLLLAPDKPVRDGLGALLTERFREGVARERGTAPVRTRHANGKTALAAALTGLRTQANKRSA